MSGNFSFPRSPNHQPNLYSVCFFAFFPFPFPEPKSISPSIPTSLDPLGVPAPLPLVEPLAPQTGAGGPICLGSSHLTVPFVNPIIIVFGFAAWGSAGNPSPAGAPDVVGLDTGREDGAEEVLEVEPATQAGA